MSGLHISFRLVLGGTSRTRPRFRAKPLFPKNPVLREDRVRRVLAGAAQTQMVRNGDELYGRVADALTAPQPELALKSLATTPIDLYLARKQDFRNPVEPRNRARKLDYHLNPMPRLAILMDGFHQSRQVRCFPEGWGENLNNFRPETIAGPVSALRRMAKMVLARGASFPHLKRPLMAFTGMPFPERTMLTEDDRNLFWKAFGVPVFERWLGFGLETLAKECEAHDGLHLNTDAALFQTRFNGIQNELILTSLDHLSHPVLRLATGLAGEITFQPCHCGQAGPRLTSVKTLSRTPFYGPLILEESTEPGRQYQMLAGD